MSILSLQDVSLTLAGVCILDHVDWSIESRERLALVGRNGAGKSTLLKLLQGEVVQDAGFIHQSNGLRVAGLTQEVPHSQDETVYHFLVQSLGEVGELLSEWRTASIHENLDELARCQSGMDRLHAWDWLPRVEAMASRLSLPLDVSMGTLSGGMKRRTLLAAVLLAAPDLLLLDEPTNHLDIDAIEWLESYLKTYAGSVVVVTHDRRFLNEVANRIIDIDRGRLSTYDCDYETFLDRREASRLSEDRQDQLFDKRLSEEEAWLREGVKARRTRNEGRVRALKAMRRQHEERRVRSGQVKAVALQGASSGQLVIEAAHVDYKQDGRVLVHDFSLLLMRGDKVGIIGPNGCGKTTLVRLLLGELLPDAGLIRQGTSLAVAYFDQLRRQLNDNETVMANVGDGSDYVTINGKQKHVARYLREFLFPPERFNQPVSSLSGGERNRLLLAKLFAKPVNFLVMDEPTNDLDIETLDLLESMLVEYKGTLLLISHDRAFLNNVVTNVLVYEGDGHFNEYVGGYDEYRFTKKQQRDVLPSPEAAVPRRQPTKLGFNEQRELSKLPQQIEQLEKTIESLHELMADELFYKQEALKISEFKRQLEEREKTLAGLYERWAVLEEKNG